ncbi:MAG TPA: hypothetical protein VN809_02420 [Telmatospirillum sp.]|nr:hypothetical protein [Telmatospirillum sp.]
MRSSAKIAAEVTGIAVFCVFVTLHRSFSIYPSRLAATRAPSVTVPSTFRCRAISASQARGGCMA